MNDHWSAAAFKRGNLARPCTLVKTEPNVVLDASLSWEGPFEHVFVKLTSENGRSIEAVCAWIAQDVGLPCPEPRFVLVKKSRIPQGAPWVFGTATDVVAFGTLAIEHAQPLTKTDSVAVTTRIRKWDRLELAGVFDLLIANDDRSEGNILLDAQQRLWLIDHGRSLGGGGHRLFSSEVSPLINNFLLEQIRRLPLPDRIKRQNAVLSACYELAARVPRIPYDSLLVPPPIALQIDDFLTKRASRLQAMALEAAGLPDLYQGDGSRGLQ